MKKDLCIQCHKEINKCTVEGNFNVCIEPDCPNYGLLQVPENKIKELEY